MGTILILTHDGDFGFNLQVVKGDWLVSVKCQVSTIIWLTSPPVSRFNIFRKRLESKSKLQEFPLLNLSSLKPHDRPIQVTITKKRAHIHSTMMLLLGISLGYFSIKFSLLFFNRTNEEKNLHYYMLFPSTFRR